MKTTKLIVGIISIVLFFLIIFQSCAAGIGNALAENGEVSGTAGMIVAFSMIIAGIIGICTRNKPVGGYIAGGFYVVGAIVGFANYGSFSDLLIWSIVSLAFGGLFIVSSYMEKRKKQ